MTVCSSFLLFWSFSSANINDFNFLTYYFLSNWGNNLISIQRWHPLNLGTMVMMERLAVVPLSYIYFHITMVNTKSNTVGCLYWLVVCVVKYLTCVCSTWNTPTRPNILGFGLLRGHCATCPYRLNPNFCYC